MNFEMTSKKRMNNLIQYKPIDRVPFISCSSIYAGKIGRLTSREFFFDVNKSFDIQQLAINLHNCEGSPAYNLPGWIGWDLGAKFDFNMDERTQIPKIIDRPIKCIDDLLKFKLPEPRNCKAFNDRLEFYKLAQQNGYPVSVPGGSPFEISSYLIEPAELLKLTRKDPNAVNHLLKLVSEYIFKIADIYIEVFGVNNCSVSSTYPLESNDLISYKTFEKLIFPHIVNIQTTLKEKGFKSFSLHLCGNHNKNLLLFQEIPLPERTFISISEKINIIEAAKLFGEKYVIGGNVPTHLLVSGTPYKVYHYTKNLLFNMKNHPGGYVLMPSCDLSPNTNPLNLQAMYQANIDFGKYS